MTSEAPTSESRETLQQRFQRMTPEQKQKIVREEAYRLAMHYSAHPDEIMPDVLDEQPE